MVTRMERLNALTKKGTFALFTPSILKVTENEVAMDVNDFGNVISKKKYNDFSLALIDREQKIENEKKQVKEKRIAELVVTITNYALTACDTRMFYDAISVLMPNEKDDWNEDEYSRWLRFFVNIGIGSLIMTMSNTERFEKSARHWDTMRKAALERFQDKAIEVKATDSSTTIHFIPMQVKD